MLARKSRFHTENNDLASLESIWKWILRSPIYFFDKLFTHRRRDRPWWPVNCIDLFSKSLPTGAVTLEFGSGSSTLWLAKRCLIVHSVEDDERWYESVRAKIDAAGLKNVGLKLVADSNYWNPEVDLSSIDAFIVDGNYRWKCIESILPRMKKSSFIYLDNSDSDKDWRFYSDHKDIKKAQRILREASAEGGFDLIELHGMIDGEFFAGSGMFLYKK